MGFGTPPSLGVRLAPAESELPDPLGGYEAWYAVTDTLVLLGLRPTAIATRLLDHLDDPVLNPLRLRMVAAEACAPAHSNRGTIAALATLSYWPLLRRAGLVRSIAAAASRAVARCSASGSDVATRGLRWVIKLVEDYPEDPLVLAPLLLRPRQFEAGTTYFVPPGTLFGHLSGQAVGVAAARSRRIRGGLDPDCVDGRAYVTAMGGGPPTAPLRGPTSGAAREAARYATELGRTPTRSRTAGWSGSAGRSGSTGRSRTAGRSGSAGRSGTVNRAARPG